MLAPDTLLGCSKQHRVTDHPCCQPGWLHPVLIHMATIGQFMAWVLKKMCCIAFRSVSSEDRRIKFLTLAIYIYIYIYIYISISISISIYLSIYLYIYLFVCLSVYLSVYLSIHPSIYLSIFVCIYIYINSNWKCKGEQSWQQCQVNPKRLTCLCWNIWWKR